MKRTVSAIALGLAILLLQPIRAQYTLAYQALVVLALGAWALFRWIRASRTGSPWPRSPIDGPLLLLVIAFTIAAVASEDARRGMGQVQALVGHILFFWLIFDWIGAPRDGRSDSDPAPEGWATLAGMAGILAGTGVVLLAGVTEMESWFLSWWRLGGAAHPLPPFGYRLISLPFAASVIACAPLAATLLLTRHRPGARIALGLWLMAALFVMVFTSSRAGWIGLVLGAGTTLGIEWARRRGLDHAPVETAGATPSRAGSVGWTWSRRWGLRVGGALAVAGLAWLAFNQFRDPTHAPILLSRAEVWPPAWAAFTSSPLVGTGPATYYRSFLAANPLSLHAFLPQAHSIVFSLLAEEGLLGFAAAGLVVLIGLRAALREHRHPSASDRLVRAAALGGMAALGFHGLTDKTATVPPTSILLIVLACLALRPSGSTLPGRPAWISGLLISFFLGFGAYTLPGQLAFERGLSLGAHEDFAAAAAELDRAHGLDPGFAWYPLEAGFAYARASDLPTAAARLTLGVAQDQAYAIHALNLAWVDWMQGRNEAASESVQRAAALDPSSPLIRLNQGWMAESSGDLARARSAYSSALDGDALQAALGYTAAHGSIADLSNSVFWMSNGFRREVRQSWSAPDPGPYAAAMASGFMHLADDDPAGARDAFERARSLDPFLPDAYRGLGLAALASGAQDEARYWLHVAGRARGSAIGRVAAWMDLMDLESSAGRTAQALEAGANGFGLLESYNSWGIGSDHTNPYAWGVFHRESLPDDLLPWVLRPDLSAGLIARLLVLAELRAGAADPEGACRIVARVLSAAPEWATAVSVSDQLACPQ